MPSSVTAVITTTGRLSVIDALKSVRGQDYDGDIEIIVVVDRPLQTMPADVQSAIADADRVLDTGGNMGGSHARNMGIRSAASSVVALLDDDDVWAKSKVRKQMQSYDSTPGDHKVVSCRIQQAAGGESSPASALIPNELYRTDRDRRRVEDYLFRNRKAAITRPSLYTSTLLFTKDLALNVPWREGLRRHQDWDWLMLLEREGAQIEQCHDPLVTISMNSSGSISSGSDWRGSLAWIDSWREEILVDTYTDFVAGQPLRYALSARSIKGVLLVFRAIVRARRIPRLQPMVIGLSGLLPRRALSRALLRPQGDRRCAPDQSRIHGDPAGQ